MSDLTATVPGGAAGPAMPAPRGHADASYLDHGMTLRSWLFTTDHKRIAILYAVSITAFFFVGGLAATLLVTLDHHPGWPRRLLSARPLVWVGLMSYGIYLWHWPLLSMARALGVDTPLGALVVGFAITPAIAAMSYHLVERPARIAIRRRVEPTAPETVPQNDAEVRAGSDR